MKRYAVLLICLVLIVLTGIDPVEAKKNKSANANCVQKIFVCDHYAAAASCAKPPCCKKGHEECELSVGGTAPVFKPSQ